MFLRPIPQVGVPHEAVTESSAQRILAQGINKIQGTGLATYSVIQLKPHATKTVFKSHGQRCCIGGNLHEKIHRELEDSQVDRQGG